MKQSTFNLIIVGLLIVTLVGCRLGFQNLEPSEVSYSLSSVCDRDIVTYLTDEMSQTLQDDLNQTSNYRIGLEEIEVHVEMEDAFNDELIIERFALLKLDIKIHVGHGVHIIVFQLKRDFMSRYNENAGVGIEFHRLDGIDDSEVDVRLVYQSRLNDNMLDLRFMIFDRENDCEDFLNISIPGIF